MTQTNADNAAESKRDPLIHQLLGDYRITDRIGQGGFALVYKGTHRYLGSTYALKVLRPERTISQKFVRRFAAEARVTAELKHPNIVRIVDYFCSRPTGQPADLHCFAMDYIPGPTLAEIIHSEGELDLKSILHVAIGVAEALEFAHKPSANRERGVVHQDIKPENIKLTATGQPVVMDFGIAGALMDQEGPSEVFFGSPTYMSPEQAQGFAEVDARSDIYSLGVMLYEAYTGRPPFYGDADTVRLRHMEAMPVRPDVIKRYNGTLRRPGGFISEIILRCLMKKPDQRYPNCADLVKHLRLVERDKALQAMPDRLTHLVGQHVG